MGEASRNICWEKERVRKMRLLRGGEFWKELLQRVDKQRDEKNAEGLAGRVVAHESWEEE